MSELFYDFSADGFGSGSYDFSAPVADATTYYEADGSSSNTTNTDVIDYGTKTALPMVSTPLQGSGAAQAPFGSIKDLLGGLSTAARDAGSFVGTVQRSVAQAPKDFTAAQTAAQKNDKISQFFMYATPVEKMMAVVAVAGLGLAAYSTFKK